MLQQLKIIMKILLARVLHLFWKISEINIPFKILIANAVNIKNISSIQLLLFVFVQNFEDFIEEVCGQFTPLFRLGFMQLVLRIMTALTQQFEYDNAFTQHSRSIIILRSVITPLNKIICLVSCGIVERLQSALISYLSQRHHVLFAITFDLD